MLIEAFINKTENWEQVLAGPPYFVKTVWDGDYFILKYNQFSSDFSNNIVQQCRGVIFYWNGKQAECVCRPFDKFFNVQEGNAAEIDWNHAWVEEKVDGSLMKWWWHNGKWHLSTNGCIDAFKAQITDLNISFGEVFKEAADFHWEEMQNCYKGATHLFELVSPETRVIVPYEYKNIYYLTSIDTITKEEYADLALTCDEPKTYPLKSLEDCLAACEAMDKNEEGFVVVDDCLHRVKIKSKGRLEAHYMHNNGVITQKRIISMLQNETIDDFLATLPEYAETVEKIKERLLFIFKHLEIAYNLYKNHPREKIAEAMEGCPNFVKSYVFYKLSRGEAASAKEYIMSKQPSQIADIMEAYNEK